MPKFVRECPQASGGIATGKAPERHHVPRPTPSRSRASGKFVMLASLPARNQAPPRPYPHVVRPEGPPAFEGVSDPASQPSHWPSPGRRWPDLHPVELIQSRRDADKKWLEEAEGSPAALYGT